MAEAIVAMFILLGGFTVIFRLFHTSMQYSTIVDAQQQKVRVAQNKLEEIRAWNRSSHEPVGNLAFSDWTYWADKSGSDVDYPEINWKVEVIDRVLYSPCELFESIKPAIDQRRMTSSCKQVTVKVNTGNPDGLALGMVNRPVVITTFVGQPSIAPIPSSTDPLDATNMVVTVAGGNSNLAHGISSDPYTASLTSGGKAILDVFFQWTTAGDCAGTVSTTASGTNTTVRVKHEILVPNTAPIYSVPGTCQAQATCGNQGGRGQGSESALAHGNLLQVGVPCCLTCYGSDRCSTRTKPLCAPPPGLQAAAPRIARTSHPAVACRPTRTTARDTQADFSATPALEKLAMSRSMTQADSSSGQAITAPEPSPRRMPQSSSGRACSASRIS